MQTIRIKVVDFHIFNLKPKDFYLVKILQRHFHVEVVDCPDYLIYSCFGNEHLNEKYDNSIKIFYTNEAVVPNFNECDYAIGFDKITFGKRYLRKGYGIETNSIGFEEYPEIMRERSLPGNATSRKFCNFIYSNSTSGEGAILRMEFCKELQKYKRVDCPGKVLNNMDAEHLAMRNEKDDLKSKINFIRDYKFTIAFENTKVDSYITEKIIHPFIACSVPIYWGAEDVEEDFNSNAFINCNAYGTDIKKMVERIVEIDQNDDLYISMLKQKVFNSSYKFNERAEIEKFLLDIIESGRKYNKDPHKKQVSKSGNQSKQSEDCIDIAMREKRYITKYSFLNMQWMRDFFKQNKKVILFGVGIGADYFIQKYHEKVSVSMIVDNNQSIQGMCARDVLNFAAPLVPNDMLIESPSKLLEMKDACVLITSMNYVDEIVEQISNWGICNIFSLLHMELNERNIKQQ